VDDGPSGSWNWQRRGKFGWIPRNHVKKILKHQYWYTLYFSIWSKLLNVVWGPIWRGNMKHRSRINCGAWEKKILVLEISCIYCNSQWDITISTFSYLRNMTSFFLQLSYSRPLIENAYACQYIIFKHQVWSHRWSRIQSYCNWVCNLFEQRIPGIFNWILSAVIVMYLFISRRLVASIVVWFFSLTSVQSQRKWTFCRVYYGVEFNILQKIRLKPWWLFFPLTKGCE